jgi:hypothetical protein
MKLILKIELLFILAVAATFVSLKVSKLLHDNVLHTRITKPCKPIKQPSDLKRKNICEVYYDSNRSTEADTRYDGITPTGCKA